MCASLNKMIQFIPHYIYTVTAALLVLGYRVVELYLPWTPTGCSPPQQKAVTLKRAGTSLWGSIKPQPSVDSSHSGSFKITSVPMSIKQQMTVGADHMWALSNKLSHLKDENKSEASEEFWYHTSSKRDKCGELLDKCNNKECCRSLWTWHHIPNIC